MALKSIKSSKFFKWHDKEDFYTPWHVGFYDFDSINVVAACETSSEAAQLVDVFNRNPRRYAKI